MVHARPTELNFINGAPRLVDVCSAYRQIEEVEIATPKHDKERKVIFTTPPVDRSLFRKDEHIETSPTSYNKENEIEKSNAISSRSPSKPSVRPSSPLTDKKLNLLRQLNQKSVQVQKKPKRMSPTQIVQHKMKMNVEKSVAEYRKNLKKFNKSKNPPKKPDQEKQRKPAENECTVSLNLNFKNNSINLKFPLIIL